MIASGVAGVAATGALSIRSTRRMVLLKRAREEFDRKHQPAVVAAPPPPMPPKSSAAYEPMQRLAEAEDALAQLVRQLAGTQGAPASVPLESVAEAERTGAEAAPGPACGGGPAGGGGTGPRPRPTDGTRPTGRRCPRACVSSWTRA